MTTKYGVGKCLGLPGIGIRPNVSVNIHQIFLEFATIDNLVFASVDVDYS